MKDIDKLCNSILKSYDETFNREFTYGRPDKKWLQPILADLSAVKLIANRWLSDWSWNRNFIAKVKQMLRYVDECLREADLGCDPLPYGAFIVNRLRELAGDVTFLEMRLA